MKKILSLSTLAKMLLIASVVSTGSVSASEGWGHDAGQNLSDTGQTPASPHQARAKAPNLKSLLKTDLKKKNEKNVATDLSLIYNGATNGAYKHKAFFKFVKSLAQNAESTHRKGMHKIENWNKSDQKLVDGFLKRLKNNLTALSFKGSPATASKTDLKHIKSYLKAVKKSEKKKHS